MRRVALVVGAVSALAVLPAPLPAPAAERDRAARRGAEYLARHQGTDGTFFGDDAPHRVAETVSALVAGGTGRAEVTRALPAMAAGGPAAARRAGEAGLLVMGIVAAGEDPRAFRGGDYVARLRSFYDARLGTYDTQQFQNALALLGVVAAGEAIPEQALTFLRVARCPDGGIPVQPPCGGGGGHVDVTALVLSALARAGVAASDPLRADARSFLLAGQNGEGGFGDAARSATSANSTGLVLGAVAALGESATEAPWRQADGDEPVGRLLALQQADGRFRQSTAAEGDAAMATRQAVPGLAGRPYPVTPDPPARPAGGDGAPREAGGRIGGGTALGVAAGADGSSPGPPEQAVRAPTSTTAATGLAPSTLPGAHAASVVHGPRPRRAALPPGPRQRPPAALLAAASALVAAAAAGVVSAAGLRARRRED